MNLRTFITVLLFSLTIPVQAVAFVCHPHIPGIPTLEEILANKHNERPTATMENDAVNFQLWASDKRSWTLTFRYKDERRVMSCVIASGRNFRMASEPLEKKTHHSVVEDCCDGKGL
jgi:hypothetical protein